MGISSPLFWLILLFLVVLVWFDGVAAGKSSGGDEKKGGKPSLWQRGGGYLRKLVKNPTPWTVFGLFVALVVLRLLIGLLPLLVFLIAAWVAR